MLRAAILYRVSNRKCIDYRNRRPIPMPMFTAAIALFCESSDSQNNANRLRPTTPGYSRCVDKREVPHPFLYHTHSHGFPSPSARIAPYGRSPDTTCSARKPACLRGRRKSVGEGQGESGRTPESQARPAEVGGLSPVSGLGARGRPASGLPGERRRLVDVTAAWAFG